MVNEQVGLQWYLLAAAQEENRRGSESVQFLSFTYCNKFLRGKHMPVLFNNCRARNHANKFGDSAFYDLNTTGNQATVATNLKLGEECIVATPDHNGKIDFSWFHLSSEELMPDPDAPSTIVRVFKGELTKSEKLSKSLAARKAPYSAFFNVLGHFKRQSVCKPSKG